MSSATPEFGFTRWGAEVVRLAEPLSVRAPEPQAPRARSIARNGGVELDVDGRSVRGRVQRGGQASVAHLEFAPMTAAAASILRTVLGAANEPGDETHRQVVESGTWSPAALDAADCSCRGRGDRCVHILAVLYATAAAIDREPALALRLRDFDASFDGVSVDTALDPPTGRVPPRWTALTAFDVRDYWDVGSRVDLRG
ncbi:SWIM zinc finger family protein [Gordonia terrae]|uniref:SWIM zinc finger family protein n=1 Tax=Gordonia terrae TaxID=2055 RepID=UPI003F6B5D00